MKENVASFNKVYVIESLGDGELHSGAHLVEEIKPTIEGLGLGLCFWRALDARAFRAALETVTTECQRAEPRTYPMLHIDAHGTKDGGISLASGEVISWAAFGEACRGINIACQNNLVVTSGTCHGLYAITDVDVRKAAPFFALVAAERGILASEADGISAFYNEVLRTGSLDAAMNRISSEFQMFLAERLLLRAYAKYIRDVGRGAGRRARVERLLTQANERPGLDSLSVSQKRKLIKAAITTDIGSYEGLKARFLLSELPENEGRFTSTVVDAAELAKNGLERAK